MGERSAIATLRPGSAMSPDHFTCFLRATQELFSSMLRSEVSFGKPAIDQRGGSEDDIAGIIQMTGEMVGAVVLIFPIETAYACAGSLLGMEPDSREDVLDAVGELTNIVAGSAKVKLGLDNISISCPSVMTGKGLSIQRPSEAVSIRVPCHAPQGVFDLCVSLAPETAAKAA